MGDEGATRAGAAPEWATVTPMRPFGARVDLGCARAGAGPRLKLLELEEVVAALRALLKELVDQHALVVVTGLLPSAGFSPQVMEDLMAAFGPAEASIPFKGVPMVVGDEALTALDSAMPGHPSIRILGNGVDAEGRPTALLANVGYCFHQDSTVPFDCTTILHCSKAPASGAETLFAKCSTLYARLPAEHKAFLEDAVAVMSNKVRHDPNARRVASRQGRGALTSPLAVNSLSLSRRVD